MLQDLDTLRQKDEQKVTTHKEENEAKIKNDQLDKNKLRYFLIICIHLLQSELHILSNLCNI